jgi:4-amino-4-deoxy-L-arabinose transferase-like glycosyltransferase
MIKRDSYSAHNWPQRTIIFIAALSALRLGLMIVSPLNLHGDEAQYWAWAQDLDWGYFTKPPMIAWVIAATTALFGDAEWAVRLSSPILHALTAYMIFRTARLIYTAQTGFWAAVIYILMPAVWLSSGIVSTDVPLLLAWIIALNGWLHLRRAPQWGYALQLGIAIGFGLLAKYAMLFFIPALIAAVIGDKTTRQALLNRNGVMALAVTAAIITPNILWNIENDFATLSHTAANANWSGIPFHPLALFKFISSQFAVFGPVSFIILLAALSAALKGRLGTPSIWLAGFTLSPLMIISFEALISRANANWAVTAYAAGSILTAHYLTVNWKRWSRIFMIGKGAVTALCFAVIVIVLIPGAADKAGLSNSLKRLRGWPETAALIAAQYDAGHEGQKFSHIMVDNRRVFFGLNYYGLNDNAALTMWRQKAAPQNQAELKHPLPHKTKGPVLIIVYFDKYEPELRQDFERLTALPPIELGLGGGKRRQYKVWAGYNYSRTTTR